MEVILGFGRDSFDRFGDDLCEELLTRLSLEQCFDCECVSKQFKRCLFRKQSRLSRVERSLDCNADRFAVKLTAMLNRGRNDILKTVLNKCVAITDIALNSIENIGDEMMAIISENCANLKSFRIHNSFRFHWNHSVSAKMWQSFGEKFGDSLQSISLYPYNYECVESLFRFTPNLIECHAIDLRFFSFLYSHLNLPHLTKVSAHFYDSTNFKLFADRFADRVEEIDLFRICFLVRDLTSHNFDSEVFAQLSRFQRLKVFKIQPIFSSDQIMNDGLNLLAERCLDLRELHLTGFTNNGQTGEKYRFRQPFKSLKRLVLKLENSALATHFEYLSDCPHLVELQLKCRDRVVANLDAIQAFAPNLRSITLVFWNAVINGDIFIALTKLDLESVKIKAKKLDITDIAIRDLITKCVGLRRVWLSILGNLSESTIDAFIWRARSHPKYVYSFSVKLSSKDVAHTDRMISYLSSIANDLPKNLKLEVCFANPSRRLYNRDFGQQSISRLSVIKERKSLTIKL